MGFIRYSFGTTNYDPANSELATTRFGDFNKTNLDLTITAIPYRDKFALNAFYPPHTQDQIRDQSGDILSTDSASFLFELSDHQSNVVITGGMFNDVLKTGSGRDTLDGGIGADSMAGGSNNDSYYIDNVGDRVIEAANQGYDTIYTSIGYAIEEGLSVEVLRALGSDPLGLSGNSLDGAIYGNSGANTINGKAGADALYGGAGDDTFIVDNTRDNVTEYTGEGIDTVRSVGSWGLSANVENLTLTGAGRISGSGNDLPNTIIGTADINYLDGKAGADTMRGGLGDDTYYVDDAGDRAIEAVDQGTDIVLSSISYTLPANVERMSFISEGDMAATGNALTNIMRGNHGANHMIGLGGRDTLYGNTGADIFVYRAISDSTSAGRDLIGDFSQSEADLIDLSTIDANTSINGNQAFVLIGSANFGRHAGELQVRQSGSNTLVSGDVNGDGVADLSISLTGVYSMTAADFIL